MKQFFADKDALNIPWVESPFFYELLEKEDLTLEQKNQAIQFHELGYVILDLELSNEFLDNVITEMYDAIKRDTVTKQAEFYTYSNSPRIFEEWRNSDSIRELCLNKKLIDTLEFL